MISARHALLRQAQEYFHQHLLGTVKWDDVVVDKAIPVPPVKGQRDQGKVRDLVVAHFGRFRMEIAGPFEDENWPNGYVKVSHGDRVLTMMLDAMSWQKMAEFIKQEKQLGDEDGRISSREAWGR